MCEPPPITKDADRYWGKRNAYEKSKKHGNHASVTVLAMLSRLGLSGDSSCCDDVSLGHTTWTSHLPCRRAEMDGGSRRTVDAQLGVLDNLLDLTLLLEIGEGFPGERTVDLETIDEGGDGDETV